MQQDKKTSSLEQFEDYAKTIGLSVEKRNGMYLNINTSRAFASWQASRACIEVELPRAYRDDFRGWVISERGTIDALKAHGIKVKQ